MLIVGEARMKIAGIQRLTLLDYPGKVACTVFLAGCNMRCVFCHNSNMLDMKCKAAVSEEELFDFLKKRRGLLDGVCITGGEPLLSPKIEPFIRKIRELGFAIKLDTNGSRPDVLKALVNEGLLDYVAMDIKNAPDRYAKTIGLDVFSIESIRESVAFLLRDALDYEFRTTVVDEFHDEAAFLEIGKWITGARRYFLQPFLDSDFVPKKGLHAPSHDRLLRCKEVVRPFVNMVDIRGI